MPNKQSIKKKRLSRNAFSEKMIHRYLMEQYQKGDQKIHMSLLPEQYHKKRINIVVPEAAEKGDSYRADLSIYFRDLPGPIPVEVKWKASDLQDNQEKYLREHHGFVIAFSGEGPLDGIPVIHLSADHFHDWILTNAGRLTRDSLIEASGLRSETLGLGRTYWIVCLRGTALLNLKKMLAAHRAKPFWAFKHNANSIKNILDIKKGDAVLFLGVKATEGHGMSNKSKLPLIVTNYLQTTVIDPHYYVLAGPRSTFFENELSPNKKQWPHFIDFSITHEQNFGDDGQAFGKRGIFAEPLATSYNYGGGAPVRISEEAWDELLTKLKNTS